MCTQVVKKVLNLYLYCFCDLKEKRKEKKKGHRFDPWQEQQEKFFLSPELTFLADLLQ